MQPINIMNEKIFVFVWFWLVVLSGVTVVSLFYHVFVMMTPAITKVGGVYRVGLSICRKVLQIMFWEVPRPNG